MSHKPQPKSPNQAKLFPDKDQPYVARGPIFDSHDYPSRKPALIIAIAGVVLVSSYFIFRGHGNSVPTTNQSATISQTVIANDSYTKLARRAIATYLGQHSDISLSNAQELFIETSLAQAHKGTRLQVGSTVEFTATEIASLIQKAQNLTASQLQAWSDLSHK